jgi:hypothetical protein
MTRTYTIEVDRAGKRTLRCAGFGTVYDAQQALLSTVDRHQPHVTSARIVERRYAPDGACTRTVVWHDGV